MDGEVGAGRAARISAGAATNVPAWPATAPPLPTAARRWIIVDLDAADLAEEWFAQARARSVPAERFRSGRDDDVSSWAAEIAATAQVGTRVAVCGAEADVLLVRAGLLAHGFVAEEIHAFATSNHVIRVRCAHCGRIGRHRARPGEVVDCPACGYDEVVHHHFSRRMAAYLAFRIDGVDSVDSGDSGDRVGATEAG